MDFLNYYKMVIKHHLHKDYIKELLYRFKYCNEYKVYNPLGISSNYYLVIDFNFWVENLREELASKTTSNLLFNVDNLNRIKQLLKTYTYNKEHYYELYLLFNKEVYILNELSFRLYNKFMYSPLHSKGKITHNHSPKLFLPYCNPPKQFGFQKDLIVMDNLTLNFEIPEEHSNYSSYTMKRILLLGVISNYYSNRIVDGVYYINDIEFGTTQ